MNKTIEEVVKNILFHKPPFTFHFTTLSDDHNIDAEERVV
jgi:hypothetical protein